MKPEDVPKDVVEAVMIDPDFRAALTFGVRRQHREDFVRNILALALPEFAYRLYSAIETAMNKPMPGCACPHGDQAGCKWRAGHGAAADLVKNAVKGSW
jgi:hypothetical protein